MKNIFTLLGAISTILEWLTILYLMSWFGGSHVFSGILALLFLVLGILFSSIALWQGTDYKKTAIVTLIIALLPVAFFIIVFIASLLSGPQPAPLPPSF